MEVGTGETIINPMILVDFGVWSRSWGGVDRRIGRRLRWHGWRMTGRDHDLVEYSSWNGVIHISHLGYMLCPDHGPVGRLTDLLAPYWRWRPADHYPTIMEPEDEWESRLALMLAENARTQISSWLNRPLVRGMKVRAERLVGRCRQIDRLHPAADREAWNQVMAGLDADVAMLSARVDEEEAVDDDMPWLTGSGMLLAPISTAFVAYGDSMREIGFVLAVLAAILAAIPLIWENSRP